MGSAASAVSDCVAILRAPDAHSHHLRDAARIVTVRLVDLRLQRRLYVPRFTQTKTLLPDEQSAAASFNHAPVEDIDQTPHGTSGEVSCRMRCGVVQTHLSLDPETLRPPAVYGHAPN